MLIGLPRSVYSLQKREVFCLPGFSNEHLREFKHVGVNTAKDQSSGNMRTTNCARALMDSRKHLYGGKKRFRLSLPCDIHNWARTMSQQFSLTPWQISGMIAYSICQRNPNQLPVLRKLVGQRLRKICRVVRTANKNDRFTTVSIHMPIKR